MSPPSNPAIRCTNHNQHYEAVSLHSTLTVGERHLIAHIRQRSEWTGKANAGEGFAMTQPQLAEATSLSAGFIHKALPKIVKSGFLTKGKAVRKPGIARPIPAYDLSLPLSVINEMQSCEHYHCRAMRLPRVKAKAPERVPVNEPGPVAEAVPLPVREPAPVEQETEYVPPVIAWRPYEEPPF